MEVFVVIDVNSGSFRIDDFVEEIVFWFNVVVVKEILC